MKTVSVLLAAGFGTRMKSDLPKVLHPVAGRPMINWCVACAEGVSDLRPIVVVGHGRGQVIHALGDRCTYAVQDELLGTAHALQQALPRLQAEDNPADPVDTIIVTYGDMPLLRKETLGALVRAYATARSEGDVAFAMLTVTRDEPQGFGRIVRGPNGAIAAIVEEVDCTPAQRLIRELNPGIYCFDARWLWKNLSDVPMSKKGEYYVTDLVAIAVAQGRRVLTVPAPAAEVDGINTRIDLARAEAHLRHRILERLMLEGVTIVDPATTYIDDCVTIGPDSTILPGTLIRGETVIGSRTLVGPHSVVVDSIIGDGCNIACSVVEKARMDNGAHVGPFGHLRSGAHLGAGVHMGNFGEVKDSYLGPGTKMGHFSYIGNARIEENVNIGAGTITCNYDGVHKHKTNVGRNVFIGSDTMLVAPLTIGDGARTGAGSVVTHDVPAGGLVYGVPARPPHADASQPPEASAGAIRCKQGVAVTVSLPAILLLGAAWLIYLATTTADAALATVNRYETRKYVKGSREARLVNGLIEERQRWITTAILLRIASLLAVGVALALSVTPSPAWWWFLLAAAATWLLVALSHLLVRVYVHDHPAQAVMALAGYMHAALWLLTPISALLLPITGRGIPEDDEDTIVLSSDGMRLIMPSDGEDSEIEESEKEMITSILEMDETVAREVMVPRMDMMTLEADISFHEALDVIIGAGHSRVPVYDDSVDQIIGVLYAKDMLRCFQQANTDMPLRALLRPAYFVPLTKNVKNLLAEMRKHRVHIAIVVDEYGGTAGLVTIEDILEEIVGEIQDEYDAAEELLVQRVGEASFLLSAKLDLYSLAKLLDTEIEDEDSDTVGGLVLGLLGHVPEAGESVEFMGWRFTVIAVEGRRIEQVRVEPLEPPAAPHEDDPARGEEQRRAQRKRGKQQSSAQSVGWLSALQVTSPA